MPKLTHIAVFPIKSLDGLSVEAADVLSTGALAWDRRWAVVDAAGQMVTGKRTPLVHSIRAEFDLGEQRVKLRDTRTPTAADSDFSLQSDCGPIGEWFSDVLGQECRLMENRRQGFPDDSEALGPTLVSTASLQFVSEWFGGLSLDEMRRRFRANLEIDGPEPFWEDRLVGPSLHRPVRFRVGTVEFFGQKPCQRCAVPTRSPDSGDALPGFAREFSQRRGESLPDFAPRQRFDHFYRLAVNTSLARVVRMPRIAIGNIVAMVG